MNRNILIILMIFKIAFNQCKLTSGLETSLYSIDETEDTGRIKRAVSTLNLQGQFCKKCLDEYCTESKDTCTCPGGDGNKCICKCSGVNNQVTSVDMCHHCEFDCGDTPKLCHCTNKSCFCICRSVNDTCTGEVGHESRIGRSSTPPSGKAAEFEIMMEFLFLLSLGAVSFESL